jgi:hypothetical protein
MNARIHGYPQLRANTVRTTHKDWILESQRFEVESASEASYGGIRSDSTGGFDEGFDGFDEVVARIDRDACGGIRETWFI